jgi:putative nucleotidyltransferase with HDIG domain
MHDVLFISDSISRSIDRASLISRAFNTQVLPPKSVNICQIKTASITVYDLALEIEANVTHIQDALGLGQPVVVFYSSGSKVEKKQAEALKGARLADRSHPLNILLSEMNTVLRRTKRKTTLQDAMLLVDEAAESFEDVCLSAVQGVPLPVDKLEKATDTISGTLVKYSLSNFLGALQGYHSHTTRHTLLVATLAAEFCNRLQLAGDIRELLISGSIVHDIGKTRIPLAILDKPAKLSQSETELVQTHPRHGHRILKKTPKLDERIAQLALEHHEYLDGSGYPDGKTEEALCQEVRLLTICDIYAALIEKRSYKPPLPHHEAIRILESMNGKLDQNLLAEFKKIMRPAGGFAKVRSKAAHQTKDRPAA